MEFRAGHLFASCRVFLPSRLQGKLADNSRTTRGQPGLLLGNGRISLGGGPGRAGPGRRAGPGQGRAGDPGAGGCYLEVRGMGGEGGEVVFLYSMCARGVT